MHYENNTSKQKCGLHYYRPTNMDSELGSEMGRRKPPCNAAIDEKRTHLQQGSLQFLHLLSQQNHFIYRFWKKYGDVFKITIRHTTA
jgi:hypothetical protein